VKSGGCEEIMDLADMDHLPMDSEGKGGNAANTRVRADKNEQGVDTSQAGKEPPKEPLRKQ
jgi:hypothetical protein